jgi:hypothetical protein
MHPSHTLGKHACQGEADAEILPVLSACQRQQDFPLWHPAQEDLHADRKEAAGLASVSAGFWPWHVCGSPLPPTQEATLVCGLFGPMP